MDSPPDVEGWDIVGTENGSVRYVNQDRTASITVWPVSTTSGDVYNCRLFVSETPHARKETVTSVIARTKAEIPEAVKQLEQHV